MNGLDTLTSLASKFSEGIYGCDRQKPTTNIFGRQVIFSKKDKLATAFGLASTGIRATVFLVNNETGRNAEILEQAVRQHTPLVALLTVTDSDQLSSIVNSGAFVWWASDSQEAADLLLLSRKIAELSLIPGIVIIHHEYLTDNQVEVPTNEEIKSFLGDADQLISSPTPSQQIIFGDHRRRIPHWFNLDIPIAQGVVKNAKAQTYEEASHEQFFQNHLPELIEKSITEYKKLTGRECQTFSTSGDFKNGYALIINGISDPDLEVAVHSVKDHANIKTGVINLKLINPIPNSSISTALKSIKALTILQHWSDSEIPLAQLLLNPEKPPLFFKGKYGPLPTPEEIASALHNMLPQGDQKGSFWLSVPFTKKHTRFPKHQVLMERIDREYEDIHQHSIRTEKNGQSELTGDQAMPSKVRQYADRGPAYSKLSRFYDDTALLYETDDWVADPFQSLPAMPPASANFNNTEKSELPAFLQENCTGCGACFTQCPHSAIPPIAIDVVALLQAGMKISASKGAPVTQLTPLVKPLAKVANGVIKENCDTVKTAAEVIEPAFKKLSIQMKLEGEKLGALQNEISLLINEIGGFPVAVTDPFFTTPNLIDKSNGEFFSLAVDPLACTACGICVESCPDDALEMKEITPDFSNHNQQTFELWENLPDTDGYTINRLIEEPEYDSLSAVLLSRNFYLTTGGSSDDHLSAQKTMLHLVTATAESVVQPRFNNLIKQMDDLLEKLTTQVKSLLSDALPDKAFTSLNETLTELGENNLPVDQIIEKWGGKEHLKLVEKDQLQRKLNLLDELKELKEVIASGTTGVGRSRYGLVLDHSLSELAQYPWNIFTTPVVIDSSSHTAETLKGLLQGHLRHMLDNLKILRRAKLEAQNAYDPRIIDPEIAALEWDDLENEEKNLVPPILFFTNHSFFHEGPLSATSQLLDTDLPVKFVLLDDGVPPTENSSNWIYQTTSQTIPLISSQTSFVFRGSLASPEGLFKGMMAGFERSGPALLWLMAPQDSNHQGVHGIEKTSALARNSRAFTHFSFSPINETDLLSSKLSLDDNPENHQTWNSKEITYSEDGTEQQLTYTFTWADWAFSLKSWRSHFHEYTETMGTAIYLDDYISKSPEEVKDTVPVILRLSEHGSMIKYMASNEVVEATRASSKAWNLLREFAGILTQFPDKLKREVRVELAEKYEDEKANLINEYENQIQNLEQEYLAEIKVRIKEKLLALSKSKDLVNG